MSENWKLKAGPQLNRWTHQAEPDPVEHADPRMQQDERHADCQDAEQGDIADRHGSDCGCRRRERGSNHRRGASSLPVPGLTFRDACCPARYELHLIRFHFLLRLKRKNVWLKSARCTPTHPHHWPGLSAPTTLRQSGTP